jgi:hypothetical protein
MATPDFANCLIPEGDQSELLPLSPFNALHYHFGMLLGEDDFKTEQGYHRAKLRLHNGWLHREGVVWGFNVSLEQARNEILVTPGLALDAAGHELHLEGDACLNVGEWFEKHKDDPEFTINASGDSRTFDAHVIIRFKACLTKQVPALMEPCNNAGTSTAYSRVFETVEILLLPNLAGPTTPPYHRLRLLFGIDAADVPEGSTDPTADDKIVLDEIARIRALPIPEQPGQWLKAFHRFAALDEIALKPAATTEGVLISVFPGKEDATVLLANLSGITVEKTSDSWRLTGGTVDTSVRPAHVATTTIQDLLCGALSSVPRATAPVVVGPRVRTTTMEGNQIVLDFDRPLQASSVRPHAFSVSIFDNAGGWTVIDLKADLDPARQRVTLAPDPSPPDFGIGLARVIARGTGPTPLLGDDNLPLAGNIDDKPAPEGRDYVLMRRKES